MKTFDEEYKELLSWLRQRRNESALLSDEVFGLDGSERCIQEQKDDAEYRKRLSELKVKHSVSANACLMA